MTHLGWTAPNGEMFATAHDMANFINFMTSTEGVDGVLSRWRKDEWFNKVGTLLPDGVSGFGFPWELLYENGRWLRTKAGNIDQFGSQMALDPNMGVAFWLAANRGGSEAADIAALVSAALFPAFDAALAGVDLGPMPARADEMVGTYFAYVPSVSANMTLTIEKGPGLLNCVFAWADSELPAQLLINDAKSEATAILAISADVPLPCIVVTELAWDGELVTFDFR